MGSVAAKFDAFQPDASPSDAGRENQPSSETAINPARPRLVRPLGPAPAAPVVGVSQVASIGSGFSVQSRSGAVTGSTQLRAPEFTDVPAPLRLPRISPSAEKFTLLQKWEGFVLSRDGSSFVGRLTNLVSKGPDEEAEFELEEVSEEDHDLIVEGAVFYWGIGYLRNSSGTLTRASQLRFRRLPVFQRSAVERARSEAAELWSQLGFNG